MNLPEKYLASMKEMLGDDFESYLNSFDDTRLYGLRVNNLKISTEEFLKISPFKLKPIPWIENGFYYDEEDNYNNEEHHHHHHHEHHGHHEGNNKKKPTKKKYVKKNI